jgi:uncharacterized protein
MNVGRAPLTIRLLMIVMSDRIGKPVHWVWSSFRTTPQTSIGLLIGPTLFKEPIMSSTFFNLLTKHQRLDAAIRAARAQRWPDLMQIQTLKKVKLAIKDRLHTASLGRREMQTG